MIKTFLQRKVQVFTSGSYQTFTEGLILFLINIQNTDEEEILPNSFYEAGMTLTLKPHKDMKRALQNNILYEYKCKNLQQNLSPPNYK